MERTMNGEDGERGGKGMGGLRELGWGGDKHTGVKQAPSKLPGGYWGGEGKGGKGRGRHGRMEGGGGGGRGREGEEMG